MAVRRALGRVAAVLVPLAGVVTLAAGPAVAADERVRMSSPSSFKAGGSPGAVTVSVSRRGRDCILPRTGLTVRKSGLSAGQVRIEVARFGRWVPLGVQQGGNGTVGVAPVATEREPLCRGGTSTRFRVTFSASVPSGRVVVAGTVTANGQVLGQESQEGRVTGRVQATPTKTPKPTATASPTPQDTAPVAEDTPEQTVAPAAAATGAPTGGGFSTAGMAVMAGGGIMVLLGVAILVFLLRRPRNRDRGRDGEPVYDEPAAPYGHPPRQEYPTRQWPGYAPPPAADHTLTMPPLRD